MARSLSTRVCRTWSSGQRCRAGRQRLPQRRNRPAAEREPDPPLITRGPLRMGDASRPPASPDGRRLLTFPDGRIGREDLLGREGCLGGCVLGREDRPNPSTSRGGPPMRRAALRSSLAGNGGVVLPRPRATPTARKVRRMAWCPSPAAHPRLNPVGISGMIVAIAFGGRADDLSTATPVDGFQSPSA